MLRSRRIFPALLAAAALAAVLPTALVAQSDSTDPRRLELDDSMSKQLTALARSAQSSKLHSLAHQLAKLVVEHYESDNAAARRVLGQRKKGGEWVGDGEAVPADDASDRTKARLLRKWRDLQEEAGAAHRDLGLALRSEGADDAKWRAEVMLALEFLPRDSASREALGHQRIGGVWIEPDDVAFVERMRGVFDAAERARGATFEVAQVETAELPAELQRMGLTFYGARGDNYTYWTSDSYEAAEQLVIWSERCHRLLRELLGERAVVLRGDAWQWHAVLRSAQERDLLFEKSPTTMGPFTIDQARLFVGVGFRTESGRRAAATWQSQDLDADYAVANVTKRHLLDMRNEGLGEGLTHAMTWLMCGTNHTFFCDMPKTVAGGGAPFPRDADEWFEPLWQQMDQRRDQPLAVVPRENPSNFRESTRMKSWSFMVWILGAHPDKWMPLIDAVSIENLGPQEVDAAFQQVFGESPQQVDERWRRWARRDSLLGEATGWRPR